MDCATFINLLEQADLLSADALEQVRSLSQTCHDAGALGTTLVAEGKLTNFQFEHLLQEKPERLRLGQYRLQDVLGHGGMGVVYKALHKLMGRVVALKVISPHLVENEQSKIWFLREVHAVTHVSHPHLVMAYDAQEVDGQLFLVMEYVDGPNLNVLVKREGRLDVALACNLIRQASLGLQYACELGMVHRDIKPANLLLHYNQSPLGKATPQAGIPIPPKMITTGVAARESKVPTVKIADFGLARLCTAANEDTAVLQASWLLLGTPDYISPEQSEDFHGTDIRSDLYSLGCVFYFALSGRVPYPGGTALEKVIKHASSEPEPLKRLRPELPRRVLQVVSRLMAKAPQQRFQKPAELTEELEQCLEELNSGSCLPQAAVSRTRPILPPDATPQSTSSPSLVRFGSGAPTVQRSHIEVIVPEKSESTSCQSGSFVLGQYLQEADGGPMQDSPTVRKVCPQEGSVASGQVPSGVGRVNDSSNAYFAPGWSFHTLLDSSKPDLGATTPKGRSQKARKIPFRVSPALQALWKQWVDVLGEYLDRGCVSITDRAYTTLHKDLLRRCRAEAATCATPMQEGYRQMEGMIKPWLSLQSILRADDEILLNLFDSCGQLLPPPTPQVQAPEPQQTSKLPLVLLALTLLGMFLFCWLSGWGFGTLGNVVTFLVPAVLALVILSGPWIWRKLLAGGKSW